MIEILNKMRTKGSGIKCLWAGNTRIEFCEETSKFDVYGEKNGSPILTGSFHESSIVSMFSTSKIEVEKSENGW